ASASSARAPRGSGRSRRAPARPPGRAAPEARHPRASPGPRPYGSFPLAPSVRAGGGFLVERLASVSLAIAHLRIRDEAAAGTLAVVSPFVADVVVEVGERLQRLPQRTLPLPRLLQLPLDPPQRRLSSQGLRPRRRPFAPRLLQLAT